MLRAYVAPFMFTIALFWSTAGIAGPYTNVGILRDDASIVQWGTSAVNYSPAPGVATAFRNPENALNAADGTIVSLGDLTAEQIGNNVPPGSITLAFPNGLMNGPGWDLAVFENAGTFFTPPFVFAELAYVEVSTDGASFVRFPSISLNVGPGQGVAGDTEIITSFGRAFAGVNATNINNLAGIHPANAGTAFDLDDLANDALVQSAVVNLNDIRFVRLVDIPGNGAFLDSQGRAILDAWPTAGSGGLDLDAIGAHYAVPEPRAIMLAFAAICVAVTMRRIAIAISPKSRNRDAACGPGKTRAVGRRITLPLAIIVLNQPSKTAHGPGSRAAGSCFDPRKSSANYASVCRTASAR